MNIFRLFESQKIMKICSKTHQVALFKNIFFGEACPEPPSKRLATPRVASPPKSWPPLAIPEYTHGLLLRNIFEEMRS